MFTTVYQKVFYPLFLQRVVEGINRDILVEFFIVIEERFNNKIDWFVYDGTLEDGAELLKSERTMTIDQAKEAAIKYIWEQLHD